MRAARFFFILLGLFLILGSSAMAQSGPADKPDLGKSFLYQWFCDADGDGIPNGLDPDWYAPADGGGYQHQNQIGQNTEAPTGTPQQNQNQYENQNQYQTQNQNQNQYQTSREPEEKGKIIRIRTKLRLKGGSVI